MKRKSILQVLSLLIGITVVIVLFSLARLKIVQWLAVSWLIAAFIYEISKRVYRVILVFLPENDQTKECQK